MNELTIITEFDLNIFLKKIDKLNYVDKKGIYTKFIENNTICYGQLYKGDFVINID